ncbi:MAG: LOG family protein [Candidatus Yanofskybacteria bacterium]|nr:LOG family protein [Candidatus Yanofskybacteria bacterium]
MLVLKYKFVVSGAAEIGHCAVDADKRAYEIGQEIVKHGGILITGATKGIPDFAARGARDAGGISIGISPAASYAAHVRSYRLPTDNYDFIIYTGFDYSGRNLLLTRSADAVIICCGRIGTLNEFTIAFEDNRPIGVLEGSGGTADEIRHIVDAGHRGKGKIVYDSDPKRLIEKLIDLISEEYKSADGGAQEEDEFVMGRE